MVFPRLSLRFFLTIRGKILLAFSALAAITCALGYVAVNSVVEAGRLVAHTYDKPLMAISYARLAQLDFNALSSALEAREQLTMPLGNADLVLDRQVQELTQMVRADIGVAEERAVSGTSAAAARNAGRAFAVWVGGLTDPAGPATENSQSVREALDQLGDATAHDGDRDRERSLALIERYRSLCLYAAIEVLTLGALIALALARRLVTPIAAASDAASRIGAGELDTAIALGRRDEFGGLLTSMSTMRDNIRRMMDQEIAARRSAQSQLADAIEGARSGVALVAQDGRVLIANSRIREFFPAHPGAFQPGGSLPAGIATVLNQASGEVRLEDGRWLRLTHSPSKEGGLVLFATDISELKQREEALRTARDAAEAANRAKTDFLTNMSHELRTPLSAVIGFSEMIARETFGPTGQPRYKEFADDILHAGRHLMDVITGILDIAKAQSGTIALRPRTVRPEAVVRSAVRIVHEKARDADILLTMEHDPDLPAIDVDMVRMRQVLLNLLSNAIKFTPAGGRVTVAARTHPDGVAIEVRDNGAGMSEQDIPRALQPFVQVDSSLARRHGGTGLGLPLTKIFVEMHGGRLLIESGLNQGTRATVILPVSGAGPSGVLPEEAPIDPDGGLMLRDGT